MKSSQRTLNDKEMLDEISSRCLARQTLRTARVIGRSYDRALAGSGITITQFTLLVAIAKNRPESIVQLSEKLDIEPSTLSRNLAKLRKLGLVDRAGRDGRAHELKLTDEGLTTLRKVYPSWLQTQEGLEGRLGPTKVRNARSSLLALRKA